MQDGSAAEYQVFSLIAKRNCSLNDAERGRAFWFIALLSGVIAVGFASIGVWLILPFAGLELTGLYFAFRWFACTADDYEQVTIRGDYLVVESRMRGRMRRFESNRHWTQVVVRNDLGSCQLALRSHGREIEFGAHLSEVARRDAARQLRERLRIQ
jgi:uncharacterized membrane protein